MRDRPPQRCLDVSLEQTASLIENMTANAVPSGLFERHAFASQTTLQQPIQRRRAPHFNVLDEPAAYCDGLD